MSQIRVNKLEGHYTIKILEQLPKRGNSNWLYSLKRDNLSVFYFWTLRNEYERIDLSDSALTSIQAGANIDVTGTGTITNPFVVTAIAETAQQTSVSPIGNLTSTDVQSALEKLQSNFDSISGSEENVQSDWFQTNNSQDDYINNKPTNTSNFVNDGVDGTNPFITLNDLPNAPEYALIPVSGTNTIDLIKDGVSVSQVDLTPYLDDTNLARLVSGILNPVTGELTVIRDDNSSFIIDLSNLIDLQPTSTQQLLNEGSNGTSTYIENNEIVEIAKTGLSIRDKNGIEQYLVTDFEENEGFIFDSANKRKRPARSWTFNISKYSAAGATAGNWNGITNFSTTNPFGVDTGTSDINLITNVGSFARFHYAPVDCYVSMVQTSLNNNVGFGVIAAQNNSSNDIRVAYEGATSNQTLIDLIPFDGTNVIIPAGYMFRPVILYNGGGIFGSFSITITEIQ